jgi:hypothetical protein
MSLLLICLIVSWCVAGAIGGYSYLRHQALLGAHIDTDVIINACLMIFLGYFAFINHTVLTPATPYVRSFFNKRYRPEEKD